MTSFWGYIAEGVCLLVLSLWWMTNTFAQIVQAKNTKRAFKPKLSHPWPGTRVPVEILYKLAISVFGLFGEVAFAGGRFHDQDGDFTNMTSLTYVSVYSVFLLHSLLDLALWCRFPLVKGSNYASAALGFFWYAVALHSSVSDIPEHHGVTRMVTTFPALLHGVTSLCLVLESESWPGARPLAPVVRAFMVLQAATWSFHTAHIKHAASPFPGSDANPSWDVTDHRNVAYTSAFFGLHLCINMAATAAIYTGTAFFMRMRHGMHIDNGDDMTSGYGYEAVLTSDDVKTAAGYGSKAKLLSSYAST